MCAAKKDSVMTSKPKVQWLLIPVLGGLFGAPSAFGSDHAQLVIDTIEQRKTADGREVRIHTHGAKKPAFSVFRLNDPFRILIDFNQAEAAQAAKTTPVKDGFIRYIATNHFLDERSSILRVEIALEQLGTYSVRTDDAGTVVVDIRGDAAANESTPSGTSSGGDANLATIGKLQKGASDVLVRAPITSGAVRAEDVSVEALEAPARLVVKLRNTQAAPKYQRIDLKTKGVRAARLASHAEGIHIVLDGTTSALPAISVATVDGFVEVRRDGREEPAAKTVGTAPPSASPAPANAAVNAVRTPPKQPPVAALPVAQPGPERLLPKSDTFEIKDIKFEPKDGFVRLTVAIDRSDFRVTRPSQKEPNTRFLRIPNTKMNPNLERTLDLSSLQSSAVNAISSYQDGSDVVLRAALDEQAEERHWTRGSELIWDFRQYAQSKEVVSTPDRAAAGFQAEVARVSQDIFPTREKYKGRRINIDLKDADIKNVLRLLSDVAKVNIVTADDVKGTVTVKLRNVPWDQALDIILQSRQLDKVQVGNILRIAPLSTLQQEEALRVKRAQDQLQLEPLTVRLIPVSYATAKEIQPKVLSLLSSRGKVNVDQRTNVLIVEDIAEVLLKVERLVRTLDTQTPQVLIESRIVEARSNFERELGIQWGGSTNFSQAYGNDTGLSFPNSIGISGGADGVNTPNDGVSNNPNFAVNLPAAVGSGRGGSLGFVFGSANGAHLLNLRLTAAETVGNIKIISSPKVVTLDNKEANIISGERVPITVITANGPTTRFINAFIELKVTPHVTQDASILMAIEAKKNELSDRVDALGVPGIITKETTTEMMVRDGDTAVVGGLYKRNRTETEAYVPWIGNIPIIGWLFKTTQKTDARDELLIFISPRVLNRSRAIVQAE
jgi:type IV pilus assembly protein PilQ